MKLRPVAVFSLVLVFGSCGVLGLRRIELQSTPILTGGQGWALVRSSYVRIKARPGAGAEDSAALRDGSLVRIIGRDYAPGTSELWFKVTTAEEDPKAAKLQAKSGQTSVTGYVPEAELDVYATRSQAERALNARLSP